MASPTIDEQQGMRDLEAAATVITQEAGESVCQQYQTVKPLLQGALGVIRAIPVYGARIATGIEFLMTIADLYCAGGAAQPAR